MGLDQLLPLGRPPADLLVTGTERRRRRNTAVVLPRCFLERKFVQPGRKPLRQPAGVGEHERRPVLLDQLQQPRMHRRPDRPPGVGRHCRRRVGARLDALTKVGHVLDRDDDLDLQFLPGTRVDNRDGPRRDSPVNPDIVAAEEPGDLVERTLRRRQSDPLRGPFGEFLEPLQRQHQMGTAFGASHGMDLIDDHGVDVGQRLAGLRREHQEQRLGGRNQNVGRGTNQLPPIRRRRVTGADPHRRGVDRRAQPFSCEADPLQGSTKVLFDIDRQRPQRRQVEHPSAGLRILGDIVDGQAVQGPKKRRQGLAGAGRRKDQGVIAVGNGRPALALGWRRFPEGRREPLPHRIGKRRQRVTHARNLPTADDTVPLGLRVPPCRHELDHRLPGPPRHHDEPGPSLRRGGRRT